MVEIKGYSDDIIWVNLYGNADEIYVDCEEPFCLAASDGTMFEVRYDSNGIWRFNTINEGHYAWHKDENPPNDDDRYSDVMTCSDPGVTWVSIASGVIR